MKKIIRCLKLLFLPVSAIFIISVFTGAYYSSSVASSGNSFSSGYWISPTSTPTVAPVPGEIVINEFMANPVGPEPAGEWVEFYNKGGSSVDVSGWVLYDAVNTHSLPIAAANVVGGSTVIASGGFLVVDYLAPSTFSLNNAGVESVRLYDGVIGVGTLIDSVSYSGTIEDKTWARLPDGTGGFTDGHDQTSGGPNV